MGLFLRNLAEKTGIQGLDQLVRSENVVLRLFWGTIFLFCLSFAIFQIVGLTRTFCKEELVASNRFIQTLTQQEFIDLFQPVYCAQDWLNVSKIQNLSINPLALLYATKSIKAVDFYAFNTLYSLLSSSQKQTVNGSKVKYLQDTSTYFIPTDIIFKEKENVYKSLLENELRQQNIANAINLLKFVSTRWFKNDKMVERFGCICQHVEIGEREESKSFSISLFKSQFMFEAEHFYSKQRQLPKYQLFLNPKINSTDNFDHPFTDTIQYISENNYYNSIQNEESVHNYNLVEQHFVYNIVLDARYRKRIVTKGSKCTTYPFRTAEVARITGLCKLTCGLNSSVNFTDFKLLENTIMDTLNVESSNCYNFETNSQSVDYQNDNEDTINDIKDYGFDKMMQDCLTACTRLSSPCEEWDVRMRNIGIVEIDKKSYDEYDYDYPDISSDYNITDNSTFNEFNDTSVVNTDNYAYDYDPSDYQYTTDENSAIEMQFQKFNEQQNIANADTVGEICENYPIVVGMNFSFNCRKRTFSINMYQYIVIEEHKLMTAMDYVGAVGGSMSLFLGASAISFIQLCLNCFTVFRKDDAVAKVTSKEQMII